MIRVKVRLFAFLKEKIGREELTVNLWKGSSCRDVFVLLASSYKNLGSVLENSLAAVNGHFVDQRRCLSNGDELAILPPVSGG